MVVSPVGELGRRPNFQPHQGYRFVTEWGAKPSITIFDLVYLAHDLL